MEGNVRSSNGWVGTVSWLRVFVSVMEEKEEEEKKQKGKKRKRNKKGRLVWVGARKNTKESTVVHSMGGRGGERKG